MVPRHLPLPDILPGVALSSIAGQSFSCCRYRSSEGRVNKRPNLPERSWSAGLRRATNSSPHTYSRTERGVKHFCGLWFTATKPPLVTNLPRPTIYGRTFTPEPSDGPDRPLPQPFRPRPLHPHPRPHSMALPNPASPASPARHLVTLADWVLFSGPGLSLGTAIVAFGGAVARWAG